MTESVGIGGVVASLALVAVAIGLSVRQGLGIERTILWACTRALVQLIAVGSALTLVLDDDAPVAWALLWVVAMVVIAAVTISRRAPEVPRILPVGFVAVGTATVVAHLVLYGLRIFPFEPIAIVPLAGMVVGNSLAATVSAARRVVAELAGNRMEVEARLALGQPWPMASRPYVRAAVRTALDRADRVDQDGGPHRPARRHDRPHPGGGGSGGRRPRPDRGDVPHPRRCCDGHRHRRRGRHPPPLHERPPPPPGRPS